MKRRTGLTTRLTIAFLSVAVVTLAVVLFGIEQFTRGSFDTYVAHATSMRSMMGGADLPDPAEFTDRLRWSLAVAALGGALLAIALGVLVARRVTRPLRDLRDAAERVARGDTSVRVPPGGATEIAALASSFNAMATDLGAASESRKRLLADVAHELRTPLSVLQGELEAVQDGLVALDAGRVESLLEETALLSRLVDDLRTLSLLDAGALSLAAGPEPLAPLLGRSVQALSEQASRKGVTLTVSTEPAPALVLIDGQRIEQVMRNLLSNAIRHTPAGGHVQVSTSTDRATVRVRVEDSGPGIPEDALAHVFDRFYRADASRSRESGGTGLGLAIVKALVEAHGGTVRAWNRESGGAAFEIALPIAPRGGGAGVAAASTTPTTRVAVQP